ncbi:MAG TPA: cytochrome C biogenesis protein [Cytophagales bacterium]|nr:cytochrome C biogenesis protein [Cytophagales bacterium]
MRLALSLTCILGVSIMMACGESKGQESPSSTNETASPASQAEPISIFGTVQQPLEGTPITLTQFENNAQVATFDLALDANGHFAHSVSLDKPTVFQLNVQNVQRILLVLHDEDIEITVDGQNPGAPWSTEGSSDTDYLEAIFALNSEKQRAEGQLNEEFMTARNAGDQQTMIDIQNRAMALQANLSTSMVELMKERGVSLAALQGVQFVDERANIDFLTTFSQEMAAALPNDPMTQAWVERIQIIKATSVGGLAPDLKYTTPTGESLALSELRGNYVLIDFWASWCKPCRAENPNVVAAYEAYKDQGFTVLGVSLDQDGNKWVRAIEDDRLVWNHISDLKGWRSDAAATYAVTSIPANYLVDPEGKIIATELRGAALHRKLQEVFSEDKG